MEEKVKYDSLGRPMLTQSDLINLLMSGKEIPEGSLCEYDPEDIGKYLEHYEDLYMQTPPELLYSELDEDSKEYHLKKSLTFLIPDEFNQLDIEQYVLNLCSNETERQRVLTELILFKERNLYPILRLMVYLVDHFRKNNLVWGVGRGSSVASYVLFLIGIHKVDSIKYNLDIEEFLR